MDKDNGCACTAEWPCRWHGEEGRGVPAPPEIPSEYLKPYPREEDALGIWKPPKELRTEPVREQPLETARIEILREAHRNGANRFEVLWWFKDGTKHRDVYATVGWAERRVASLNEKGEWRTIWRNGKPVRFQDEVVSVEVGSWYGQGDRMIDCACGCGERFLPTRSDQAYVNERHSTRARVRAFRERARNPL